MTMMTMMTMGKQQVGKTNVCLFYHGLVKQLHMCYLSSSKKTAIICQTAF